MPPLADAIKQEAGDYLLAEGGEFLILEAGPTGSFAGTATATSAFVAAEVWATFSSTVTATSGTGESEEFGEASSGVTATSAFAAESYINGTATATSQFVVDESFADFETVAYAASRFVAFTDALGQIYRR